MGWETLCLTHFLAAPVRKCARPELTRGGKQQPLERPKFDADRGNWRKLVVGGGGD